MTRPKGMAPSAFDAYIRACFHSGINPQGRVMQTIGAAKASAGTHAQDGVLTVGGKQIPYCAAVDLRTRDLTATQIKKFLHELARQGFAGWYRFEGSFSNNRHIHAIFVGLPMKPALRVQVLDFLADRNGLVGHAKETFWTAPTKIDKPLAVSFVRANPKVRGRVSSELLV